MIAEAEFEVVVTRRTPAAEDIVLLELRSPDGADLPEWTPGAHIDVVLVPGATPHENLERQYSLCGDPADRSVWRIGVLREREGRGGSARVHDAVAVGDRLVIRGPRSHFALAGGDGPVLFVAGGIGITPILPMIAAAEAAGRDWRLAYAGRSRATMAFARELSTLHGDRVEVFAADEGRRLDLAAWTAAAADGVPVHCCGPTRMVDEVEALSARWPADTLHRERFEPKTVKEHAPDVAFEVELELSGLTLTVPADRSVLEVVEEAGALVLSSCREGTCGTCETPVIEGVVDHRDSVLTPAEQASNTAMMICVSRAACPRLVLEL
ncbi:PDR/VanB family oxidoreductase [Leifsonia sp. AG29]|uniref:PDR/VanB family oxidoreductase n=1 Tax=Leifsonia sp. AG29 TaxID=2598860 RepID=UPI00131AF2BF|nr:PDR/VanB family oxidoreductase [Leifsonia sp. AG29]